MSEELSGRERRQRARELEELMAELDRADQHNGLGSWPVAQPKRREHTRRTTVLLSAVLTAMLLSIVVALHPSSEAGAVRQLLGFGSDRLLAAPTSPGGSGNYAFIATQRNGKTPVGYDPCRTIEIAINPDQAPDDYRSLVENAIAHTSEATGLDFRITGTTDARPSTRSSGSGLDPVLVAFATEDEVEALEGNVAGVAGSAMSENANGRRVFVTGSVVLDADVFNSSNAPGGTLQAIVDHEFGHLVGLDHVDDPNELMFADNVGVDQFGPGDLKGLAKIGQIACS